MKVIIPVAGVGTRLRPHTYTQPKPLIPVAGKPIISFIIDSLVAAGVTDFVFVIGHLGEKIRLYLEKRYPSLNKEFVVQENRLGLGHAIWTARGTLKGVDELFIILGDTIYDTNLDHFIHSERSCLGVRKVSDPGNFGVAEIGDNGKVSKLVEKPKIPKSNMALVGLYKINEVDLLVESLDKLISKDIRTNDEYQLTDALMMMVKQGVDFDPLTINNWYDCGKKEVLLETNTMLLKKKNFASSNLPSYYNTIVIHPVAIGKNCNITNSIVGPHVTIGDNTVIRHSVVSDSIIGNYAQIEEIVLKESVIGNDTSIKGFRQSLNIGDNTEIDFSK
jgi:glucose-1-phosphate thymidylyltransferase